jgi:hypothetical protein
MTPLHPPGFSYKQCERELEVAERECEHKRKHKHLSRLRPSNPRHLRLQLVTLVVRHNRS